jgi:hypothetical protein
MRYREFELTEDELFELKMSPSNLARMAKSIDARAGLEFELIVPGVQDEEEEFESEPDYDADERFPIGPGWRRDVVEFFRGGEMGNSTSYIERRIAELDENFYGWFDDEIENYIGGDAGQERALEIATDNVSEDDYDTTEEYQSALLAYIEHNEDKIRTEIEEELRDDADSFWERYLDEEGINSMADFANEYDLEWPYWTQQEYYGGGGASIDAVAQDFSDAIGRSVNAASGYHSGRREPGKYVVEPDSSLHGDNGESGLEFVSPPLTIPEMIEDIDKVAKWAGRAGAYTNESTGLHMNVSVPGQANLDYVKLAMFLGDNYILEQFGREGNTYCKSALNKIKQTARANPDRVDEMLRQFQGGLNQLASKLIHTGSTEKYTSINVQSNRVEFRSPGGDWLGEYASDPGKITNTLLRTVVALDVATKPEEYKQEYYKKLYKTLSQGQEDSSIEYFAKYAAGELPKAALKSFIRQIQTKRQVGKEKPDQTPSRDQEFTGTWEVVSRPTDEVVHTISGIGNVVADAERHAQIWAITTGFDDPIYVRPQMRPRDSDSSNRPGPAIYSIIDNRDGEVLLPGQQGTWVYIQTIADNIRNRRGIPREDIRIIDMEQNRAYLLSGQPAHPSSRPTAGGEQSSDANYEIVDYSTAEAVPVFRFIANTDQDAQRKFQDWLAGRGIEDDNARTRRYGFRAIAGRPTATPIQARTGEPVPAGSAGQQTYRVTYTIMDDEGTSMHDTSVQARNADAAMDQVRQALQARGQTPEYISADPLISTSTPARSTESLPPGNVRWLVLDRNDQEVYSFINTTAQSDANQYARQWMTTTAPREVRDRGPFTIVPAR